MQLRFTWTSVCHSHRLLQFHIDWSLLISWCKCLSAILSSPPHWTIFPSSFHSSSLLHLPPRCFRPYLNWAEAREQSILTDRCRRETDGRPDSQVRLYVMFCLECGQIIVFNEKWILNVLNWTLSRMCSASLLIRLMHLLIFVCAQSYN